MNCEEFKKVLPDLDRPLTDEALTHIEECHSCNSWLDTCVQSPPSGLPAPSIIQPPPSFSNRVMPQNTPRTPPWIKTIIATLALGISLGLLWTSFPKAIEPPGQHPTHEDFSFIPKETKFSEMRFMEPLAKGLGEDGSSTPQGYTFMEMEKSLNFMDDDQEEDS